MGIYLINICGSLNTAIVDSGSFEVQIGEIWSYDIGGGILGCGEIISISEDAADYNLVTLYESCYDCITGSSTETSYLFQVCDDTRAQIYVNPLEFGSLPTIGDVYQLVYTDGRDVKVGCFEFLELDYNTPSNVTLAQHTLFGTCENCPPRSANTETTVCVICCDCGATGSTTNIIVPPHPIWTDGYGNVTIQMNMITIGGNGLNS
jgi:hypothetical protein